MLILEVIPCTLLILHVLKPLATGLMCMQFWRHDIVGLSFIPGVWSSPGVSGTRPPPLAGFSFTVLDDHRAILFGGVNHREEAVNDAFILDVRRMVSAYR